jgi:hypothetical protein
MVIEHPLFRLVHVPPTSEYVPTEFPTQPYVDHTAIQGRAAWKEKHTYLGCDPVWHSLWELTIPKTDCLCNEHYVKLKKQNPPDFSSPENYFRWGVWLHNEINERLGKQQVTLEEAIQIWNRTDVTV